MRVKCIANNVNSIKETEAKSRLLKTIHYEYGDSSLIVGCVYTVIAISYWNDDGIRIYLQTVSENYPHPYPIEFFNIIDNNISEGWCIRFGKNSLDTYIEVVSFPEWVNDDTFYERLLDEDKEAIAIYKYQRDKIFANESPSSNLL